MERDEPPSTTEDAPPATAHTPVRNSGDRTPKTKTSEKQSTPAKTPTSVAAARPTMGDMHPSKVHQSTTKKADSGLILGFNPVKRDEHGNVVKDSVIQDTPTKARATSPSSQYGTPGFEFKFACQESELSDEARKLMESLRGDAARIRDQMQANGDNEQQPADDQSRDADRRIARPKGKASRFSNAHMAEFKKMDSIAGHPSAFRAAPGRFQPVDTTSKTLKRTKSNARLDEPESQNNSPSKTSKITKPSGVPAAAGAKRVKHDKADDASTRRPTSQEASDAPPATPRRVESRPRPAVRSSLMTPTRASAARATSASVKPPRKPSMIPAPTQSPAAKTAVAPPRTPRTDFNPRIKTNLPSFANLKSILRRREPLFSKDPSKIASGTHVAAPDFTPNLLFKTSNGDTEDATQTPSPRKRVYFSPSAKSPGEQPPASPSPSKIPTAAPSARPGSDVTYPSLPVLTPEKGSTATKAKSPTPTIRQIRPSDANEDPPLFPEIPGVMHGINNKKRHRVEPEGDGEKDTENVPPADSNVPEERSAKRVKVNTPTKAHQPPTPSPVKMRTNTPSSRTAPGVRRTGTPASVRKSGFLTSSRLNMLAQPKHR